MIRRILLLTGLIILLHGKQPLIAAVPTGLSGTYVIGGPSADYSSIGLAVSLLNSQGISGNVTFRIFPGLYDEQVTINDFARDAGAETATVTFKTDVAGNPPTWQYSAAGSTSNWIVNLNGAHHIIFDELTFPAESPAPYARHIIFDNGAHDITIRDSTFEGHLGNDSTHNSMLYRAAVGEHNNITIENNTFTYGHRAIDWRGPGGGYNSKNMSVIGNHFGGQEYAGAFLDGIESATVSNNSANSAAWSNDLYLAIYVAHSLSDNDPTHYIVTNNTIDVAIGRAGIWVNSSGLSDDPQNRIATNLISVRDSTNGLYGIYNGGGNVGIYHNTVRTMGNATAMYNSTNFDYQDIDIRNNIFAADGGGKALVVGDYPGYSADHNNYYTTGAILVRADGIDYSTINDYKYSRPAFAPHDSFSVFAPTTFVDIAGTPDLHLAAPSTDDVALLAPKMDDYLVDFDGDPRSVYQVFKGADEGNTILPLDDADTVDGYYTVGGNTPDYGTPRGAIFALNQRGVKGDVTFRIRAGTYDFGVQQLQHTHFGGTYTVTLRAANMNNRPILTHTATSARENYLLKLNGTTNVRLRGLQFEATGTGGFGRILHLDGWTSNTLVDLSTFTGITGETTTTAALIYAYQPEQLTIDDDGQEDNEFAENEFIDGSYGIYHGGIEFSRNGDDNIIRDSQFTDQAVAAIFTDFYGAIINGNDIRNVHSDVYGIYLHAGKVAQLMGNTIVARAANSIGVYGFSADGSSFANPALMANNSIVARQGVRFESQSSLWNIYHNTIYSQQDALYINPDDSEFSDVEFNILNNILHSAGSGGVALSIEDPTSVDAVDHNNLLGSGALVHYNGTNYASLANYQAASGLDANSVNKAVTYADLPNSDLHLAGGSDGDVDLGGIALVEVSADIDGDQRSTSLPYMGADEATTPLTPPTAVTIHAHSAEIAQPSLIWLVTILLFFSTIAIHSKEK